MLSPEERIELAELLTYQTRTSWERRRDRLRAAETRLGLRVDGVFVGYGLAEVVDKGFKDKGLTPDEFIIANLGMHPEDAKRGTS